MVLFLGSLIALTISLWGCIKRNIALMVTGQCIGAVLLIILLDRAKKELALILAEQCIGAAVQLLIFL